MPSEWPTLAQCAGRDRRIVHAHRLDRNKIGARRQIARRLAAEWSCQLAYYHACGQGWYVTDLLDPALASRLSRDLIAAEEAAGLRQPDDSDRYEDDTLPNLGWHY